MNYFLAAFVGAVSLWAAYNRFGAQNMVILGVLLFIGAGAAYRAFNPAGELTDGQRSLLAWIAALTGLPAALVLLGGLVAEFSG